MSSHNSMKAAKLALLCGIALFFAGETSVRTVAAQETACTCPDTTTTTTTCPDDPSSTGTTGSPAGQTTAATKTTTGGGSGAGTTPNPATVLAPKQTYCAVNQQHTVCKYDGPTAKCAQAKKGLTDAERAKVLEAHNTRRRNVAKGMQSPQPGASNMVKLTWDFEAAAIAQRWLDQCGPMGHDVSRETVKNGTVYNGQNAYMTSGTIDIDKAVGAWFDEVKAFSPSGVNSFAFSGSTGHYTQLVWAETRRVGCGLVSLNGQTFFTCNYAPGGNMQGKPLYKTGKTCSACPTDLKNCDDGLCTA